MFTKLLHSTFAEGENIKQEQFRTAVIGAEVAKHLGLKIGESFQPQHGVGGEKHIAFKIVGVLDRTSTPVDRAAFVNMEGFFLIPDHAKRPRRRGAQAGRKRKKTLRTKCSTNPYQRTSVK